MAGSSASIIGRTRRHKRPKAQSKKATSGGPDGRGAQSPTHRTCADLLGYVPDTRILVPGDRYWRCDDLADQIVNRLLTRYGPDPVIVHGGAPAVDQSFHEARRKLGIVAEPHLADWTGLGNIARPERNREMVQAGVDLCLALDRSIETSKGTKDCVRQALAAGCWVYLIESERAIPDWMTASDELLARPSLEHRLVEF
jgi:hypothetical protein